MPLTFRRILRVVFMTPSTSCVQARFLLLLSGFSAMPPPTPLTASPNTKALTITPRQMAMQCAMPEGCHVHLFVPQQSPVDDDDDEGASSLRYRVGGGGRGGGPDFTDREIAVHKV